METRKEKFRRYREEIRHMPDSAFERYKKDGASLNTADLSALDLADSPKSAISYGAVMESAKKRDDPFFKKETPYQSFLARKRNRLIAKFVALFIAVVLMTVWFLLLQGRK